MRLIKAQSTNLRGIYSKGVKYDIDDQVVVDSTRAMKVPVGTLGQRPGEAGVDTSSAIGQVRYNSTDQQLEAYQMAHGEKYALKNQINILVLFGRI